MIKDVLRNDHEKREDATHLEDHHNFQNNHLPHALFEEVVDDLRVMHEGMSVGNGCVTYTIPKLPKVM